MKKTSDRELVNTRNSFTKVRKEHSVLILYTMSDNEEVPNYYKTLPKKFKKEERTYPSLPQVNIKLPFQMCVTGKTGSGKTNAVMAVVKKINAFDKVMIFAKLLDEPLYAEYIESLREIEKKTGAQILTVSTDINDLPKAASLNDEHNTLLIVDDMVTEKHKALQNVVEYYTFGRKKNVSAVFISQSYFDIPTIIRKQTGYYIFTKISGDRDLNMILKDFPMGITEEQLHSLYRQATAGGFPNFFLVDVVTNDVDLRFRRNFKGIKPPETAIADVKMRGKLGKFNAKQQYTPAQLKKIQDETTLTQIAGREKPEHSYKKEEVARPKPSSKGRLREYEDTRMEVDANGHPMEEEDFVEEMDTGDGIGKKKRKRKSRQKKERSKKRKGGLLTDEELWKMIAGYKK